MLRWQCNSFPICVSSVRENNTSVPVLTFMPDLIRAIRERHKKPIPYLSLVKCRMSLIIVSQGDISNYYLICCLKANSKIHTVIILDIGDLVVFWVFKRLRSK